MFVASHISDVTLSLNRTSCFLDTDVHSFCGYTSYSSVFEDTDVFFFESIVL
jgi:hypothetical protein